MTRARHLQWCKDRAFEYLNANDVDNAWASMVSDLGKHEETKDHLAIQLGMSLLMMGNLSTAPEMGEFIEGFN